MEAVAVGILVEQTTHQAAWVGLAAAAGFVPIALFGPLAGVLADRRSRRNILLATTLIQTAFAAVLTTLAALGEARPGFVTIIVFGSACAGAIGFPTFQAMLPDLVPREDIPAAVALSSAQWNLGRVVGPALAGVVIAVGGYSWAFAVNTASFLAVLIVVLPLQLPIPQSTPGESVIASMLAGLRFARDDPGIRTALALMIVNSLLAAPFIGLVASMAIGVLDGGEVGTSLLVTGQGIGAVAMAFSLGTLVDRFGVRRQLLGSLRVLPAALVAYAYAPNVAIATIAITVVGFFYLGAFSCFTTVVQLRAPSHMRGRALSAFTVTLGTAYPIGLLIQGVVADWIGLRATTAGAAVLMAVGLGTAKAIRPNFGNALDSPTT